MIFYNISNISHKKNENSFITEEHSMTHRARRFRHIVSITLVILAGSAHGGPVEDLMKQLPADSRFVAAFGGTDALQKELEASHLAAIWNDPQVQVFYSEIRQALEKMAPDMGGAEEAEQAKAVEPLAREFLRKPLAVAVVFDETSPEKTPSLVIAAAAGLERMKYEAALKEFLTKTETKTRNRMLGGKFVIMPEDSEEGEVYWGWQGMTFLLVVNDPSGRVVQSFGRPDGFSPALAFEGIETKQEALAVYWDVQDSVSRLKAAIRKNRGEQGTPDYTLLFDKLGLSNVRRFALRGGFEDKNIVVESFLESPAQSQGLSALIGRVEPKRLCGADAKACTATAFSFSFAGLYDLVMETLQSLQPAEPGGEAGGPSGIAQSLAGLEQAIQLRSRLLAGLSGPMMFYSVPALAVPEAPGGGAVLVADLQSPEQFTQGMESLEQLILGQMKANETDFQIRTQPLENGQTARIWVSGMAGAMGVMPCWTVKGTQAVIASHPALIRQAAGQTLCDTAKYKAAENTFPAEAVSVSYTDTESQVRQFVTQLQQFWPLLRMQAMGQGIELPMMLPNIESYLSSLPPTTRSVVRTEQGFKGHYRGPGLELNAGAVAGGAMGAAILMPALNKTKMIAQRVVSATNLKEIGLASHIYASEHGDRFAPSLETLASETALNPKVLTSPYRKSEESTGPDYYYLGGQSTAMPSQNVLAFDNPRLCMERINVLYVDGRVVAESPEDFKTALKRTLDHLKRPVPDELKYLFSN